LAGIAFFLGVISRFYFMLEFDLPSMLVSNFLAGFLFTIFFFFLPSFFTPPVASLSSSS